MRQLGRHGSRGAAGANRRTAWRSVPAGTGGPLPPPSAFGRRKPRAVRAVAGPQRNKSSVYSYFFSFKDFIF